MKDFIRKLRKLDAVMESIWDDPKLSSVVAHGTEGTKDLEAFQDLRRRVQQMRASARIQLTPEEKAGA